MGKGMTKGIAQPQDAGLEFCSGPDQPQMAGGLSVAETVGQDENFYLLVSLYKYTNSTFLPKVPIDLPTSLPNPRVVSFSSIIDNVSRHRM